jgi:hypothetical protein
MEPDRVPKVPPDFLLNHQGSSPGLLCPLQEMAHLGEREKVHSPAEPLFSLFCVCQMGNGGEEIPISPPPERF